MQFLFASNCAFIFPLFFICLRSLRFLFDNCFVSCFRLAPSLFNDSENKHVYCLNCSFSLALTVEIRLLNSAILFCGFSAILCISVIVSLFSLFTESVCFLGFENLLTLVLVVLFGTFGHFSCLISDLKQAVLQ